MSYVIVFVVMYVLSIFFMRFAINSRALTEKERLQFKYHHMLLTYVPVVNIVCAFCLFVITAGVLAFIAFNNRKNRR